MRGFVTAESSQADELGKKQPNMIPYSRQEFASHEITLNIVFHCDTLRLLGLSKEQQEFMWRFAAYKTRKLIDEFPRLRTACIFDPKGDVPIVCSEGNLPSLQQCRNDLDDSIKTCFAGDNRRSGNKPLDIGDVSVVEDRINKD